MLDDDSLIVLARSAFTGRGMSSITTTPTEKTRKFAYGTSGTAALPLGQPTGFEARSDGTIIETIVVQVRYDHAR